MLEEQEWPALFSQRHVKDANLDVQRLAALWRGEIDEEYGAAAVTGTAAIALQLMGKADSPEAAQALAEQMWNNRNRESYVAAA